MISASKLGNGTNFAHPFSHSRPIAGQRPLQVSQVWFATRGVDTFADAGLVADSRGLPVLPRARHA